MGNSPTLATDGRGADVADVDGQLFATWGDNEIRACALTCGPITVCSDFKVAGGGGGSVDLPRISSSGYIAWESNTPGDGQGRIGVYNVLTQTRFKLDSTMGALAAPTGTVGVFEDRVM